MVLDIAAANRDATVFDRPEEYDPTREVPTDVPRWGHAFGGGMHACIGTELARRRPDRGGARPGARHRDADARRPCSRRTRGPTPSARRDGTRTRPATISRPIPCCSARTRSARNACGPPTGDVRFHTTSGRDRGHTSRRTRDEEVRDGIDGRRGGRPQGGPGAAHRAGGPSSTTSDCPAPCTWRWCAASSPTVGSSPSTPPRPRRCPACSVCGRTPTSRGCRPAARSRGWSAPCLARDRVRFVGEPVAVVVASDRYLAADAAGAVVVDYEDLPVMASVEAATAPGATADPRRAGLERRPGPAALRHRRRVRARRRAAPDVGAAAQPALRRRPPRTDRVPGRLAGLGADAVRDQPGTRTTCATSWPRCSGSRSRTCGSSPPDVGGGFGAKASFYPEFLLTRGALAAAPAPGQVRRDP